MPAPVSFIPRHKSNCPRPQVKVGTPHPNTPPSSWGVPDMCSRYNFPSGTAPGGSVIAIYEYRGGWSSSDMTAYFASISQPVPSITDVSADGGATNNGTDTGGNSVGETTADIQAAAAAYYYATGQAATIRVYWDETTGDPTNSIIAATADGCDVFSTSWGYTDIAGDPMYGLGPRMSACEAAALAASQAGMVCVVAAGDRNADDGTAAFLGTGVRSLDFPTGCPHFLSVGGTTLGLSTEVVWNATPGNPDGGPGTGGGYSRFFPAEAWQLGFPAAPTGFGYAAPDVVSCAKSIEYYVNGALGVADGTSFSAPFWAGLIAAAGPKLGFITPKLYMHPGVFNDITSGDNGGFYAATGVDAASGLGSPNATSVLAILETMGPFKLEGGGNLLLEGGGNLQLEGV